MEVFSDMFLFMNMFTIASLLILIQNRPELYAFLSFVLCLCGVLLDYFSCCRQIFRYVWDDDVTSPDVSNERPNSRCEWQIQDSPDEGRQSQRSEPHPNLLTNFPRKLHEYKENWTSRDERASPASHGFSPDDIASPEVGNEHTNSRRSRQFLKPIGVIYSLIVGLQLLAHVAQNSREEW